VNGSQQPQTDYDLIADLGANERRLREMVTARKADGIKLAEARESYTIAKAECISRLRAAGNPVTLISDLVYGDKTVAALRRLRDIAEVVYDAGLEAINITKREQDTIKLRIETGRRSR